MTLPNIDWGKLLSTTFPGLIVAVTIYMAADVISGQDLTAKALGGEPGVLAASLVSLAAFSTFLGVFLDAIGHVVFENWVREHLPLFQTMDQDRDSRLRAVGRSLEDFGPIYRVQVDKDLRQQQLDAHYRYTEFSTNGTLALLPFTIVFPIYALRVLELNFWWSLVVAFALAGFAGFMSWVAVHNLVDWEEVRWEMVSGTIDKIRGGGTGKQESPAQTEDA